MRRISVIATSVVLSAAVAAGIAIGNPGTTRGQISAVLNAAYDKYKDLKEGSNADYIPALAKVDPRIYGIALVTVDGEVFTAGDVRSEVSIQSISKVFTLARVIQDQGEAAVRDNVGFDATGQVFNSIVAIEQYKGKEMNPLVNAGAIATTSMVRGRNRAEVWNNIIATYDAFAGRKLGVNQDVFSRRQRPTSATRRSAC